MRALILGLVAAMLTSGSIRPVRAQTTQVDIASSNLTTHTSADTSEGRYYTLAIALPSSIERVRHAWLELRLDVSVADTQGFRDPVPVFQVFMLKQSLSGEPSEASFETMRMPMSRPVAAGTNRLVKIDITEYLGAILAHPSANHGLVLGSATGSRVADFAIRTDSFGLGIPARLTVLE